MKLKNKLFIKFSILFFISLNVFGFILIQSIFYNSINDTIDTSFREYAIIYSDIKVGENLDDLFLTNKELISIKSETYLNNIKNPSINLEFKNLKKDLIYTSKAGVKLPQELYKFKDSNKANYMIFSDKNSKTLVINKIIEFNNSNFYFSYMNNIDNLYNSRINNFFSLAVLNVILGIILMIVIYYFSNEITMPLNLLIKNIDEIIKGNYNKKLNYKSDIEEINTLTKNFNIMNKEIENKISLLNDKNLEKQRFIDNLTHEIRTPLTSIVGYSSLMINKNIQDVSLMHKSFENIYKDGKRIESLTTNLIKLITLDKTNLDIKNISVLTVIKDVESLFKIRLSENNIIFNIIGDDFKIDTDTYLISTLMSNFIDNSIKAVKKSSNKYITISLENKKIILTDSGCGISKEDLGKIFEPFYMVDKSRESSFGGFGLGLSICFYIIKRLNIKFDISSEEGVGTKITLDFKGGLDEKI